MNSTTGVVAAWAANETPRISATHRRRLDGAGPARRAVSPEPHAMIPAVASSGQSESGVEGPLRIDQQEAGDRPAQGCGGRAGPAELAGARATPAMTPARTTDGDGLTKATYTTIATAVRVARRRRWRPPASAPSVGRDDRNVPAADRDDVAIPAIVKASARSRSTRSRSPIRSAASPASGSGIDRSTPSAADRRNPPGCARVCPLPGGFSRASA